MGFERDGSPQPPPQEKGALKPLDYLQSDHEAVRALGLSDETAHAFGLGYAPRGILRGRIAVPIRDRAGVLLAYCGIAASNEQSPRFLLPSILGVVLGWALVRWFCAHVETEDGATKIAFAGGVLAYIGWSLLVAISFVTIIGWAWALKYFMRWICARIEGAPRFAFNGGGFAILWRAMVFTLCSVLVIPIPWLLKWYGNWIISQFSAEPEAQR